MANERIALESVSAAQSVVPGMWALYRALKSQGLEKRIKIQTPQHPGFIAEGLPPSTAYVQPSLKKAFADLLDFVTKTGESGQLCSVCHCILPLDLPHLPGLQGPPRLCHTSMGA